MYKCWRTIGLTKYFNRSMAIGKPMVTLYLIVTILGSVARPMIACGMASYQVFVNINPASYLAIHSYVASYSYV